jgi:hypothetical protein
MDKITFIMKKFTSKISNCHFSLVQDAYDCHFGIVFKVGLKIKVDLDIAFSVQVLILNNKILLISYNIYLYFVYPYILK